MKPLDQQEKPNGETTTAVGQDLREAPEKFFSAHSVLSEYATKAAFFFENFRGIPNGIQKVSTFCQSFTRDFEKKNRANESNDFVLVFFESGVKHVELLRWVLGLVFDSQSTPERSNGFQLLSPFDSVLSNRRIGQRFSSTYSLAPSLHWEITSRPSCRVILELLSKSNKSSKSTDSQDT